jgi:uroporphyrinogen III methyltransferase/synthase
MSSPAKSGHVWLVGAGPGHPGLITAVALSALRSAEVVLFDRLASSELLNEAPDDAILIDAGKAADNHTMTQDEINASLVEHGLAGYRVVRLKGGDPYVFGRGGEEAIALNDAGVSCTVIPGVTSAIGGLAFGGVPVTHRGVAASFAVVTGHEDPTKPMSSVHWDRLATATDTLVVLMGVGRLEGIAEALIAGGRPAATPAALVQQASLPEQRSVSATLETIADTARSEGIEAPALLVVGDVAALLPRLEPRRLAPLGGRRVLVTRTRSQASALVDLLRLEGAHPVVLPAIEVQQRADREHVERSVRALQANEYRWVVFTSANAVDIYMDWVHELGGDARSFAGTRVCAIGVATGRALEQRGIRPDLLPSAAIGEGVVSALQAEDGSALQGAKVLLPRAEGARDVMPAALTEAGATIDELTMYLSAPPAEAPPEAIAAVRNGDIDIVTFTSSSTVTNLAEVLGGDLSPLSDSIVACIGPVVAQTAEEMGLPPAVVAEEHTIPGLVDAVRRYVHSQQD